jgi:predicted ATP-grasp superfamily ATP-dependent carboligase
MPAPRTCVASNADQLERIAHQVKYPCVVKPDFQTPRQEPQTALKVQKVSNAAELLEFYRAVCGMMPRVVVQEWIPGGDHDVMFCLQYYDHSGEPLVSFCGRKIRQWPPLCGNTASCEPIDSPEMERITTEFFRRIGFQGLCSMEFKRDPRDGNLLMVEPTIGRTDHQSGIADINGVPIPYIAYCDQVDLKIPRFRKRYCSVRWTRWSSDRAAARAYMRSGELSLLGFLWTLRPPVKSAVWSLRDPGPSWSAFKNRLGRKVRRLSSPLRMGSGRIEQPEDVAR